MLQNRLLRLINGLLSPIRLIIPQPFVNFIPGLMTNYDIRTSIVLEAIPNRATILDIGCGTNRLVMKHQERGGKGVGVDIHDWGDVDMLVEDSSNLPLENDSFDVVTFVACLNHIPNRESVLQEAVRVLKPNGVIVSTNLTPTISKIWHKIAWWDSDQHERGMEEGEVWGFTDSEFRHLLNGAGLEVIDARPFSWGLNRCYRARKQCVG